MRLQVMQYATQYVENIHTHKHIICYKWRGELAGEYSEGIKGGGGTRNDIDGGSGWFGGLTLVVNALSQMLHL